MKIQIIGIGRVGSTIASLLIASNIDSDIILTDINGELMMAEYYDLSVMARQFRFYGRLLYSSDIQKADIYVIVCGESRKPYSGMSKQGLYESNLKIVEPVFKQIAELSPCSWTLIATNPSSLLARKGLDYIQKAIPLGLETDTIEDRLSQLFGRHETIHKQDIGEYIFRTKGYTNFGIAGEAVRIIRQLCK